MKKARILRGVRKGDWGVVTDQSHLTRKATVEFPDGEVLEVDWNWLLVVNSNNDEPKSRLFGGL